MQQQEQLIDRLSINRPNNLILVGPKYSGKKLLVQTLYPDFYWIEGKVDKIRQIHDGNVIFADIDNWSPACFSAMLKLLEENTEYQIIITCKNIMNLPRSIQSRCIIEKMEPYKNIGFYCDNIGQLEYVSEDMLKSIKRYEYKDEYDLDVYFSVLCNYLKDQLLTTKDLTLKSKYLICSKYNSAKNLKSLNNKQFILNWTLDMKGLSNEWKRL